MATMEKGKMATAAVRRKPRKITKRELEAALGPNADRLRHLDLVGSAEAALNILGVERARIGKWRRIGILLGDGKRIQFPEPIYMATTAAKLNRCGECGTVYDHVEPKKGRKRAKCPSCGADDRYADVIPDDTKLAATPLWWADDIRDLKKLLDRNRPRN